MSTGRLPAIVIAAATVALIVVGTLWPIRSAIVMAGAGANLLRPSASPQAAVEILAGEIGQRAWEKAYSCLANKN